MSEWEVKTVRRDHTISRQDVETYDVEGKGQMEIWLMEEVYVGKTVNTWEQTAKGRLVQGCSKSVCQAHKFVKTVTEHNPMQPARSWMCDVCTGIQFRAKQRVESREAYKLAFPERIMKFSRALRKRHPELNSRKSRKDNDVIVNGDYWAENDALRRKINIFGYEHNLHVNRFKSQDDNDGEGRVRFSMVDISPMFDEHFRDHGHKGGIMAKNR